MAIELQRDWRRVSRAAAERAAIENELAAIRRRKLLLVLQIKRAIAERVNTRGEFLTTLEDNRYLIREGQLRRQDLRRITTMQEQVRMEKENFLIQLRRQRQRAAEVAVAYMVAIAQIHVSFRYTSDFNTDVYFIYIYTLYTKKQRRDLQAVTALLFIFRKLKNNIFLI